MDHRSVSPRRLRSGQTISERGSGEASTATQHGLRDGNEPLGRPYQPGFVAEEPEEANLAQSGSEQPEPPSELTELRKWLKRTREQEELNSLRALRLRYEAGDVTAVQSIVANAKQPSTHQGAASTSLPRPEPPQTYSKKNRAEYNRWERDCEGYFLQSPAHFPTEVHKVDFGARYISEPLKTLWRAFCDSERAKLRLWVPTWVILKTVMLDALGTPAERKQNAYEALRRCRQRPEQSPNDLLDYMRPFWEELETSNNPELQVLQYTGALADYIQRDLFLLSADRRSTLSMVEEQANVIYRRRGQNKERERPVPKGKAPKHRRDSSGSEGGKKPPKFAKKAKLAQSGPKRGRKRDAGRERPTPACYECGDPGHFKPDCPKLKGANKDNSGKPPGKDKGQKA